MNCQKNDIAVIVRMLPGAEPWEQQYIGRAVKCIALERYKNAPAWEIYPELDMVFNGCIFKIASVIDYCLQPIRGLPVTKEIREELTA